MQRKLAFGFLVVAFLISALNLVIDHWRAFFERFPGPTIAVMIFLNSIVVPQWTRTTVGVLVFPVLDQFPDVDPREPARRLEPAPARRADVKRDRKLAARRADPFADKIQPAFLLIPAAPRAFPDRLNFNLLRHPSPFRFSIYRSLSRRRSVRR